MSIKINNLGVKIADFCYNKDATRMAVACDKEVRVYHSNGKGWELVHTLTNHQLHVSGVDWDHTNDRIVSISHDRNAFVWTYHDDVATWKPALVVVRCARSLLTVKWSPKGNKFAIGAADNSITVCYFDGSQDWWVTKKAKKTSDGPNITSSVTCLDWHDNNMHVVAGTALNTVVLYMCYVKETESKPAKGGAIKFKSPFTQIWSGTTLGRVTNVRFVPGSDTFNNASCIATDEASCIYFFDSTQGSEALWTVATPHLAFTSLMLLSDSVLCGAGWGFEPILYKYSEESCEELKQLDPKKAKKPPAGKKKAADMFKNMDKLGQEGALQILVKTKHQNTISNIRVLGPKSLCTAGIDGRVVQWAVSV